MVTMMSRHADEAGAGDVVCTCGRANGWRSSRYGSLPKVFISCLGRHPCYYSTACHTVYIYGYNSSAYANLQYLFYPSLNCRATAVSTRCSSTRKHLPSHDRRIGAASSNLALRHIIEHHVGGASSRDSETQTCLLNWQAPARACTISPP